MTQEDILLAVISPVIILPVRMDWSTLRVVDLMEQIRMSAGTLSPTATKQINNHTHHPKHRISAYSKYVKSVS